jgi:hypothetical protein
MSASPANERSCPTHALSLKQLSELLPENGHGSLPWFLLLAGKHLVKVTVQFVGKGECFSRLKMGCLKFEQWGQILRLKYLLRNLVLDSLGPWVVF